jgi:hypothetical protein
MVTLSAAHNPTQADIYFPGFASARSLAAGLRSAEQQPPPPLWVLLDQNVLEEGTVSLRGDQFGLGEAIAESCTLVRRYRQWCIYRRATGD